jgi:hypothetical protein
MKRFCGFPPTPEFTGDLDEMSLLAGESVGQTKRLMSTASIIDEMMRGAEAVSGNDSNRWSLRSPPALRRTSQGYRGSRRPFFWGQLHLRHLPGSAAPRSAYARS